VTLIMFLLPAYSKIFIKSQINQFENIPLKLDWQKAPGCWKLSNKSGKFSM